MEQDLEVTVHIHSEDEVHFNLVQKRATSVHDLGRYMIGLFCWTDKNLYHKYRDQVCWDSM